MTLLVVCQAGHVDGLLGDAGDAPPSAWSCPKCRQAGAGNHAFERVTDPAVLAVFEMGSRPGVSIRPGGHMYGGHLGLKAAQELWDARHVRPKPGDVCLFVCPDGHWHRRQLYGDPPFTAAACGAQYRKENRVAGVIKSGFCAKQASLVPMFLAALCEMAGPEERMRVLHEHGWAPGVRW